MIPLTPDGRMRQEVQCHIVGTDFCEQLSRFTFVLLQSFDRYESRRPVSSCAYARRIHADKSNHQMILKVLREKTKRFREQQQGP
jgi:hypothetical protein